MNNRTAVKAALVGVFGLMVTAPTASYASLKRFNLTVTQSDFFTWHRVASSSTDWRMNADSGWTLTDINGCAAGAYSFRLVRSRTVRPDQEIFKRVAVRYCANQQQIYSSWPEGRFHFDKASNAYPTPVGSGFISQSW